MREIKFRGRGAYQRSVWYAGDLVRCDDGRITIRENEANEFYVNPDTVGQFTGLRDSNGKEIYEGDVVRHENCICLVVYNSTRFASFALRKDGWAFDHYFGEAFEASECQVIGNVHDSPELLEADDARD